MLKTTPIFIRNFILFAALLLVCSFILGFVFIKGNKVLTHSDSWMAHSHRVMSEMQIMSRQTEAMLARQRSFLVSRDFDDLAAYDQEKASSSERIALLSELVEDNASQASRVQELQMRYLAFTQKLDEQAAQVKRGRRIDFNGSTDELRKDLVRVLDSMIAEEAAILNERASDLEYKKEYYYNMILAGGIISLILLLILNAFLLKARSQRDAAERSLEEVEERLKLALRGSSDGIFDWDLRSNEMYWSHEYKSMLGYRDDELKAGMDVFNTLVHQDDIRIFWSLYEDYIQGRSNEFVCVFRMRHKSGRWIWVNARGKALFDQTGQATRFIGAHTDVSHLKEYEHKLQETIEKAERANQAKSDFLAHMSHEIRTPLTAISGIAEIFERNMNNLNDKQMQLVRTLNTSTFTLRELINDILDFSKIESGELELEEKNFQLSDVFEQVQSIMSVKANEKGLSFVMDYKSVKTTSFLGDAKRLRQILINLIGNALKFTDQGHVNVRMTKEIRGSAAWLRIDVEDSGIGFDQEKIDLIFERFKQGDASVSRKYGGTGLGLPISKSLAILMGGDIMASGISGEGATFTLLIPIKAEIPKADDAGVAEQPVLSRTAKPKANTEAKTNDKSRILMVEDYEGNIVVISYILEEMGIAYDVARTGVEALRLWEDNLYDVVLMDIQMPEMDGFTATARIRKAEAEQKLRHTPIIGMTAHALVGDRDKCIEAGMDAYLPKPIVEMDLKSTILKYMQAGPAKPRGQ